MKALFFIFVLTLISIALFAQDDKVRTSQVNSSPYLVDSVKLQYDGSNAFYQKVVKVDSNINENLIYIRTTQFMAAKNFQQTYGYEEEGKLIYTAMQDLNMNPVNVNDDRDAVQPFTVQFAITVDLKSKRYRYTIHNVTFYLPTETGNRRETLADLYLKETNADSRRVARDARNIITSFERYITTLTTELHKDIEQKLIIRDSKF